MKRLAALALAFACSFAPAVAADRLVVLTLDQRPVDRAGGAAVLHNGIVFADSVDLLKSFDGLLTFSHGGTVSRISIRGTTGLFAAGSKTAVIGGVKIAMPGAPFMRNGDLYVPLVFFITRVANAKVTINPAKTRADIRVNANPFG